MDRPVSIPISDLGIPMFVGKCSEKTLEKPFTYNVRYGVITVNISADPSALCEGEAQGKREANPCQLAAVTAPDLGPACACFVIFCPAIVLSMVSIHPCMHCFVSIILAAMFPSGPTSESSIWSHVYTADLSAGCKSKHHCTSAGPNLSNGCDQSFQPHPPTIAFSGAEGAVNQITTAHQLGQTCQTAVTKASSPTHCTIAFSGFGGARRHPLSMYCGH